jgi:hypothetical protein
MPRDVGFGMPQYYKDERGCFCSIYKNTPLSLINLKFENEDKLNMLPHVSLIPVGLATQQRQGLFLFDLQKFPVLLLI